MSRRDTCDPAVRHAAARFERDAVRALRQAARNWRAVGEPARARRADEVADRAARDLGLPVGDDAAGLPPGWGRA